MNEAKRNELNRATGSPGAILIDGVMVEPCERCASYHPAEPHFDDASYTFYDNKCWVAPERREIVQADFNFEANKQLS